MLGWRILSGILWYNNFINLRKVLQQLEIIRSVHRCFLDLKLSAFCIVKYVNYLVHRFCIPYSTVLNKSLVF